MLLRLSQIKPVVGASRRDVENYLGRLTMSSEFQAVVPGQARLFSYKNTIELALISAFVTAGLPASRAASFAMPMVAATMMPGVSFGRREWLVIPAGEHQKSFQVNSLDGARLSAAASEVSPPVLALVNIGEIYRRVDALFFKEMEA